MMKNALHVVALLTLFASPAIAGASPLAPLHVAQAASGATSRATAEGEVRKVDKGAGKITLRHGEIRNLEMPSMTMVFQVKDKSMIEGLKEGDKVRFSAEKIGGSLVVTSIEPSK